MTLSEVATKLDITREKVRQIESLFLKRNVCHFGGIDKLKKELLE